MICSRYSVYNINMNLKMKLLIVIMLAVAIQSKRTDYPQGMWPLSIFGQFLGNQERILGYFDFNRDRYVDLVTFSNENTLNIYLWSDWNNQFVIESSLSTHGIKILSVLPTNFTNNDRVDLIVTYEGAEGTVNQAVVYEVECNFQQCVIAGSIDQPFTLHSQPTLIQFKGKNTLVYSNGEQLRARTYNNGTWEDTSFASSTYFSASESASQVLCKKFQNIHFLDYSGDCNHDIIIHCVDQLTQQHHLQFLRIGSDAKYEIFKDVYPKVNSQVLYFAVSDINFDGLVDLLILFKQSNVLQIELHYNIGIKDTTQPCKLVSSIKQSTFFPFHFINDVGQLSASNGIIKIQRLSLSMEYLETDEHILRMGDVNNDGYVDMIVDTGSMAKIFLNQQCSGSDCGSFNPIFLEQASILNIRKFTKFTPNGLAQSTVTFCAMSFFDLYEDGHLDILGVQCTDNSLLRVGKVISVLNSMALDAFFMKITVLSNPTNQKIKESSMDLKLNTYGAHVDLFVTSLSGQRIPACGNQLSNPGISLQLPYIHLGLGRTNNYVEDLSVSIYRSASIESYVWTPIVPNSQLIIVPGPSWILQTFISPTEIMSVVFWFVVLVLVGIGFVIIRLTRQEKLEDKENEESFYAILR